MSAIPSATPNVTATSAARFCDGVCSACLFGRSQRHSRRAMMTAPTSANPAESEFHGMPIEPKATMQSPTSP
ncbi:Uncharacterised protein [Mycobacteroides abscessus subsp. abscessus]|nr:Uncharacterised protein [Mycobacteroides abscessus subsp. abscessus]